MIFRRTASEISTPAVSAEASCREVARVMQLYLDGRVDDVTAARVAKHLDACRDCGLEASTYETIRVALLRRRPVADEDALARLQAFGASLVRSSPDDGLTERNRA